MNLNKDNARLFTVLVVILIMAFGTFCIAFPLLVWRSEIQLSTVLDFGRLLLSWPVAVLVLGLTLLFNFRSAIDFYLRNLRVKLPGGIEMQSQPSNLDSQIPETITLSPEQQKQYDATLKYLHAKQQLTEVQRQELEQAFRYMRNLAQEWKFYFLWNFYVPTTKNVLFWFYNNPGQSRSGYDVQYMPVIPDIDQRNLIIDVLIQYGCLIESNGQFHVTSEGKLFLQYSKLIP